VRFGALLDPESGFAASATSPRLRVNQQKSPRDAQARSERL